MCYAIIDLFCSCGRNDQCAVVRQLGGPAWQGFRPAGGEDEDSRAQVTATAAGAERSAGKQTETPVAFAAYATNI